MQTQIHPPNMWPAQIVFILQAIYIYDICPFHYKAASTKTSRYYYANMRILINNSFYKIL